MAHQADNIAANIAAAAVPNLADEMYPKSIGPAAERTRTNKFLALPLQVMTAPGELVLDGNGARTVDPCVVEYGRGHDRPRSSSRGQPGPPAAMRSRMASKPTSTLRRMSSCES